LPLHRRFDLSPGVNVEIEVDHLERKWGNGSGRVQLVSLSECTALRSIVYGLRRANERGQIDAHTGRAIDEHTRGAESSS
jgi:hypothetical protein